MINKLLEDREKKKYRVILSDRKHLTDFERLQLIPDLKSRLEILKDYFSGIIKICNIQSDSQVFVEAATKVINSLQFHPDENSPQVSLAKKYFGDIAKQSKEQGIDWIDEILEKFQEIHDVNQLILFLNDVSFFCSAMATVRNDLLLYRIETYPYIYLTPVQAM